MVRQRGNLLRMETPTKKRGRVKGASSYAKVTLEELNQLFGPKAYITISKRWLSNCNLTENIVENSIDEDEEEEDTLPVEKISYKLTSFN